MPHLRALGVCGPIIIDELECITAEYTPREMTSRAASLRLAAVSPLLFRTPISLERESADVFSLVPFRLPPYLTAEISSAATVAAARAADEGDAMSRERLARQLTH